MLEKTSASGETALHYGGVTLKHRTTHVKLVSVLSASAHVTNESHACHGNKKRVTAALVVTLVSKGICLIPDQGTTIVGALLRRPLTMSVRLTLPAPCNCGTSTTLI